MTFPRLGEKTKAEYKQYTEERVHDIKERNGNCFWTTLTLFELPNYKDPRKPKLRNLYRHRDPQPAIRLAWPLLAVCKIHYNTEENLPWTCKASVRDGLRHLGYLPVPIGYKLNIWKTITGELTCSSRLGNTSHKKDELGWRLSTSSNTLPCGGKRKIEAWLPGKGFRPFREVLLEVNKIWIRIKLKRQRREEALGELRVFIQTQLMEQESEDVLVLTRLKIFAISGRDWTRSISLISCDLSVTALRFQLIHYRGRLRLLRLRTSMNERTPEWYIFLVQVPIISPKVCGPLAVLLKGKH